MKKGFTLVELLTVIAILGIVMTLAGTAVFKIMDESRNKLLEEQLDGLADTAVTYVISKKTYLKNCSNSFDLKAPNESSCFVKVKVSDLVSSGFFENTNNLCDLNGEVIVYKSSGELKSFVSSELCSY